MLKDPVLNELSEKGRARYYQIKPQLKESYEPDDVVLIEVETGDYFVGQTTPEAYSKAREKYPDKEFFIAQVGQLASLLKPLCKLF